MAIYGKHKKTTKVISKTINDYYLYFSVIAIACSKMFFMANMANMAKYGKYTI
jgi:hypothetical protein